MYVLDTNTLIYFFKGIGNVSSRLLAVSPRDIAIPTIVLYELEVGIEKTGASAKRRKQLRQIASVVNILPFGTEEARSSARIRVQLEKAGRPIGPHDILIAGTAVARRGTLVTHNREEFGRIKGLAVEDWF